MIIKKVFSIDPAPSKGAVVFDGAFKKIPASELVDYCKQLASPGTLLCWDAPLTGPYSTQGSFSQRLIEQFFSRQSTGFKTPKGISVLPYSGCPHWAITRACLGLPICGAYDLPAPKLPFALITENSDLNLHRPCIIETHPALAIWLWCRGCEHKSSGKEGHRSWLYKANSNPEMIKELWGVLKKIWKKTSNKQIIRAISNPSNIPDNDDKLDAIVGWVLGTLLLAKHSSVGILGDSTTGAIILPLNKKLKTAFNAFWPNKATSMKV